MGITGDRYVGEFDGHTIELVRNNWVHALSLLIDGRRVARESCHFPHAVTLTAALESGGRLHEVVARSVPRRLIFTHDTVEIDGQPLEITKTK